MITDLLVSNYRSLGEVRLRPGRLSVLVGPNGSGKSNVLDVLSFVRDAVTQGLSAAVTHRGGIDSVRRRSHGRPFDVRIKLGLSLKSGPASYEFVITGDRAEEYRIKSESATVLVNDTRSFFKRDGNDWTGPDGLAPRTDEQSLALVALGGDERFRPLVDFFSQLTVYSIFPDVLREPQKFDSARPMKCHGENWVSILRDMLKQAEKRTARKDLIVALKKVTGDIEDARVTPAAGYLVAEFMQQPKAQKGKRWFSSAQQSDGTLRVAGLLTALLQTPSIPVVGVEEPELTIHPGVLPMLYDYLRQASEVSQVMVTTHSPTLLDVLDVERDRVFAVGRKKGITHVRRVSEERLDPVRRRLLSLGDLLLAGDLQLVIPELSES